MWNTESLWVEVAVVSFLLMLGHIFFGHFEERSPKLRKLGKAIATMVLVVVLSYFFGRVIAFAVLAILFLPVIYIHAFWLPNKGINGWTGEPKSKYYEMRGWSKDIFRDKE